MAKGEYDIALPFLRKAIGYAKSENQTWALVYGLNDIAQSFLAMDQQDSTEYYAQLAVTISKVNNFRDQLLRAYQYLYQSFEKRSRPDSLNKYFRLAMLTKDSIYDTEKNKIVQTLAFRDQLRQQEIENEKAKAEQERKTNIQYAAIAIGLILFLSLFLFLSRSIIVNEKWIRFLGVLGLLAVFEFINLLIHPYLGAATHHSPVLMLLALMAIAALLVPLHHKVEHWLTHKMIAKNKRIRLAAAKKTIIKLNGDPDIKEDH
jgi:hypothetical protein